MLNRRGKLLSLDAFVKTEEDVRIRTNTGGLITIISCIIGFLLLIREWNQFNELVIIPKLVVDRDRNLKLDLNFDITFPSISCDILTLDIMDDSGDLQLDLLESGFTKTRVAMDGEGRIHDVERSVESFNPGDTIKQNSKALNRDSNYCGPCYGAVDQSQNEHLPIDQKKCCQTCDQVHDAYLKVGWAFFDGKDIEQCESEGYVKQLNDHIGEGCRVKGKAKLNRIKGNIHFAPGKSYQDYSERAMANGNGNTHYHDISLYKKHPNLNFNHIINHFSFGKEVENPPKLHILEDHDSMITKPMDGRVYLPKDFDTHFHVLTYFAKIVPTRFEFLDTRKESIETSQFSATFHDRPLQGGRDFDHPTTIHMRGGIPGVFINFEMSPIKIINKEQYSKTWSSFILNCFTTIGSVLAVATMSDRVFYKAQKRYMGKKSK